MALLTNDEHHRAERASPRRPLDREERKGGNAARDRSIPGQMTFSLTQSQHQHISGKHTRLLWSSSISCSISRIAPPLGAKEKAQAFSSRQNILSMTRRACVAENNNRNGRLLMRYMELTWVQLSAFN